MTPPAIVEAAIRKGLAMIAICDHNSGGNIQATQEAAGKDITVLAGMEIMTVEEVHVLGIFPDLASALAVGRRVRTALPEADEAYFRKFGDQPLMDARGQVVGRETRMLAGASVFGLSEAIALIKEHGGRAIASHVDRPSFSVIGQLGLFPTDAGFDAVEVSPIAVASSRVEEFTRLGPPVICSSDSHFLSDVGKCCTALTIEEPTFGELSLALKGIGGRKCALA